MKKVTCSLIATITLFVIASCNEKRSFESLNGEWRVVTIGEMSVPDSVNAFLGFNIAEQLIYGSTGCNQLTGTMPVESNSDAMMFGAMGCTRMICADMSVEDAMLPALAVVVDFELQGDTLSLMNAEKQCVMLLCKR